MGRGGYTGSTEPIGLIGCFVLIPFYLFGIVYIIEVYGFGGSPGWLVLLSVVLLSAFTMALALGFGKVIRRFAKR